MFACLTLWEHTESHVRLYTVILQSSNLVHKIKCSYFSEKKILKKKLWRSSGKWSGLETNKTLGIYLGLWIIKNWILWDKCFPFCSRSPFVQLWSNYWPSSPPTVQLTNPTAPIIIWLLRGIGFSAGHLYL